MVHISLSQVFFLNIFKHDDIENKLIFFQKPYHLHFLYFTFNNHFLSSPPQHTQAMQI